MLDQKKVKQKTRLKKEHIPNYLKYALIILRSLLVEIFSQGFK